MGTSLARPPRDLDERFPTRLLLEGQDESVPGAESTAGRPGASPRPEDSGSADPPQAQRDGLGIGRQPQGLRPGDRLLVVQVDQVLVEPLHPSFTATDVIAELAQAVLLDELRGDGA